jgi:hypothetical protein
MGNPIGGLVYSNGLPSAKDNTTLLQANNWNKYESRISHFDSV